MPRKIDAGELVAALGGLLVFVALFLEWFGPATGWQVFESLDLVLAGLALAAIATGGAALGAVGGLGPRALLPVGLLMLVVIVVQLVEPPPVVPDDLDVGTGAWLALAGSLLVVAGGVLRVADIDVTVSVGARDTRRRVAAVDRRPTAPAAPAAPAPEEPAAPKRSVRFTGPASPDPEATQPFAPVEPSARDSDKDS